jgi:mono/diheme cytochrome c family protein
MMKRSFLVAWACWAVAGATSAADGVDYNRDVRPILADHCFTCHGPDEAAQGVPPPRPPRAGDPALEVRLHADRRREARADLDRYRRDPTSAKKLIATGATRVDARLNPEELAAYTLAANVLFNLDEVMTKE